MQKEGYQMVHASAVVGPRDESLVDKLAEVEAARQKGLLTQEEHDAAKQAIMKSFIEGSSGATIASGVSLNEASAPTVSLKDRSPPTVFDVVPTNAFHGRQNYARIWCPIAGHPEFDKGAYHHPMGMCCYTENRQDSSENISHQFMCMPMVLALYIGTLCYQPCGCICGGQIPWLGDCPCTEQRVTAKFMRDHPNKISKVVSGLVLTKKGSPNQCIFDRSSDLRNGQAVSLTLISHSGMVITKHHPHEKTMGPWRYIKSDCAKGGRSDAITVRYEDNEFLKLADCDLVFDVKFWKYDVNNSVNFVGGSGGDRHRTHLGGGGRSWNINDDGTVSLNHHPHLVLGL